MTSKELYAHAENLFKAYSLLLDTDRGLAMQVYEAGTFIRDQAAYTEKLENEKADAAQISKWLGLSGEPDMDEMEAQAKDHREELRDLYPPY